MSSATLLIRPEPDHAEHGVVPRLIKDRSGVTSIEYGLIASLIAVAAIAALTSVGTNLSSTFSLVASNL